MVGQSTEFEPWLARWGLEADGSGFTTGYAGNRLLPVTQGSAPAMLKLSRHPEERRGAEVMRWWDGEGAARVLAQEGEATLLERVIGPRDLAAMARSGEDDAASRILCAVADRLHMERPAARPTSLVPLKVWLRALPAAAAEGGVVAVASSMAGRLLDEDREPCVLHGDLHHGNVLDGGPRGWLAIDPKGVFGPRGYDYANILCNPDAETALAQGRLERQVQVVADAARLERRRLLEWLLVHASIAGVWCRRDGFDAGPAVRLAAMAQAMLKV